jgi:hypothetical protein
MGKMGNERREWREALNRRYIRLVVNEPSVIGRSNAGLLPGCVPPLPSVN